MHKERHHHRCTAQQTLEAAKRFCEPTVPGQVLVSRLQHRFMQPCSGAAWTNRDSFFAKPMASLGHNADTRKVARASLWKTVECPVRNCEEETSIKDILHVHSVAHSGAPPHPPFSVSTIGGGWLATVQTAFLGKTDNPAPPSRTRRGETQDHQRHRGYLHFATFIHSPG